MDIDVLMMRYLKTEPGPDMFFRVISNGRAAAVADILTKWPEMVSGMNHVDKPVLQRLSMFVGKYQA